MSDTDAPRQPPEQETTSSGTVGPGLLYAGRVGFGILWRLGLMGTAVVVAGSGFGPPWYAVIGFVAIGVVLGLWRSTWRVARLWRMAVVAAGVAYVAPLTPVALPATEAGFGIALLAPWIAARSRH